jgi:hypothetical protein
MQSRKKARELYKRERGEIDERERDREVCVVKNDECRI